MQPRPSVSVIVPFLGTETELTRLLVALERLEREPGDELIVADNRLAAGAPRSVGNVSVQPAGEIRSPGAARNRGAARASAEWLLFLDADTEPEPELLRAYFDPPPKTRTAILAGAIIDVAALDGLPPARGRAARHAVARGQMNHGMTLDRPTFPYAQTANCAIRHCAFDAVGGFEEAIRAAEDADLCFRLVAQGWEIESRPAARVRHLARRETRALLRQLAQHGAGAAWCNRRHPGSFPPPTPWGLLARLTRSAGRAVRLGTRGEREGAFEAGLEVAEALAFELGRLMPNRSPSR
jgi:GT2 family glycosyltransferase